MSNDVLKQPKTKVSNAHGITVDMDAKLTGLAVNRKFNIKADTDSPQREINVNIDFSMVDITWLLNKALRTIVIDQQRTLRQLGDEVLATKEQAGVENVLLDPTPTRSKLSDSEKAMRLLAKLDDETKAKLLAELNGK